MLNKIKFRLFLLYKLPIAFLSGLRLVEADNNNAIIRVKHRWINQNPFNSMYFAIQAMAAEISTGLLILNKIKQSGKSVSMLVIDMEARFTKKATGWNYFECADGKIISSAIKNTLETKEAHVFWVKSIACNDCGEIVSEFNFKWSIKERK